jgi:lipoate---protein ligase
MNVKTYDLPDAVLLGDESPYRCMIWQPGALAIILGQSNNIEASLFMDRVNADNVPVYKRPSGGETVILSPNTLVISVAKRGDKLKSPKLYFKSYNEKIVTALTALGIKNLRNDGISDICIGEKKILGSSIYRNKNLVLYHAVLNRAESTETIQYYLKHPLKEPEYRKGRNHEEFVTSLKDMGYDVSIQDLREKLSLHLKELSWT